MNEFVPSDPEERMQELEAEVQSLRREVASLNQRILSLEQLRDDLPKLVVQWLNEHSDTVYG